MTSHFSRWTLLGSSLLLLASGAVAGGRPPGAEAGRAFPTVNLPRHTQGEDAITALGDRLPELARAYGKSEPQFKSWLRRERTLRLDRQGRMYYADDVPQAPAAVAGVASPTAAARVTYALEDTFRLHSLPGAHLVIYLDFNGRTLSGTAWNYAFAGNADMICPPFDFEGGPAVFTENERLRIQAIWQRVAEDYAPFTVDVTTEDPGEAALTRSDAADPDYGVRVLISPASGYFGSYGGISYVGVFDAIGDFYKPSLVFSDTLYNSEKYIAEACAHESGHSLGLSHDGTTAGQEYYPGHGSGETGWAPIMGASYYRNVTQWSRGEYPLANNTEDQLAILASRLPYRADDHAADASSATGLPPGATLNAPGLIGGNADADVFAFWTGAGAVTLNLAPAALAPDLDLTAELFDASGTLVATSNPTACLGAGFAGTLSAGQYFVRVQATGCGDLTSGYSCYGSLGAYTLTGTLVDATGAVPPTAVATASVTAGFAPLTVQLDGSASSDADGTLANWLWDFGDGQNSTQPAPSHIYSAAGSYSVTLTVTDNDGLTSTSGLTITVTFPNTPPTAKASATPSSGIAPLTVTLSAAGSADADGTIVSYAWNFGDGATGAGASVSHLYQSTGNYLATLTVTDDRGATATAQVTISVGAANIPPVAFASATPASGTAPLTVTLSAAGSSDADGTITSYAWNFGDGATGSGASIQHLYQVAGTYVATLTVTDNRGATATAQVTIQVQAVSTTMRVETLTLKVVTTSGKKTVQATVRVTTTSGQAVSGATVAGTWSGQVTGIVSGKTGASGTVVLTSPQVRRSGTVTFRATGLTKTGLTYDATKNLVASASIVVR